MTIYLLFQCFFDGDSHPSPSLLSAHLSEDSARAAVAQHLSENPTTVRYAYGKASPNGSVVAVTTLEGLRSDERSDYLIVPLEAQ